uniref:Uncharacterized protein n=1 Tax=Steinernema glaseri TaxID=37863 RepID=A0A1I7XWI2_9BILA
MFLRHFKFHELLMDIWVADPLVSLASLQNDLSIVQQSLLNLAFPSVAPQGRGAPDSRADRQKRDPIDRHANLAKNAADEALMRGCPVVELSP